VRYGFVPYHQTGYGKGNEQGGSDDILGYFSDFVFLVASIA
jgi:hypothetical protein